ncbi:ornithine--oxo-acid transaminase [Alkaliphilus peptidifermentans]|uniref:ornithine aminotransferase n=1 Tax=Alkaliphilus peptidifermentans DSM 18978 TaxID=1120976 RepID=A0A1G5KYP9_9FIRM|nr:ornithine--oxo-acid transaminase [Alkaliphilus peptidifermentans]SCZ05238.1 ornithine--oxo-acid transaminase [Alkaliphilus peptidifermentans DSM 18978]
MKKTLDFINQANKWGAHNYHPIPVVIESGEGCWVYDVEGKKYLDMLSAYSAVNQGHRHPKIVNALIEQVNQIPLTSRAFHNNKMGSFLMKLCQLSGYEKALPMNTGAEAVETALKAARKWGYVKKKVEAGKAEIIACSNNFHGRTISIVSFSSEDQHQNDFGPVTPGFKVIPYGDADALEHAINENTVAFIMEPIQGEAGIIIPPEGYLKKVREITKKNNVLLIMDEIQTGFGRTGKLFAHQHEDIRPDIITLGKALGGGLYPISAILADDEVMEVFTPGDHGSTFGGNPLAAAIGMAAIDVIVEEGLAERADELGTYFIDGLKKIDSPYIKEIRGKGLMVGLEIKEEYGSARPLCEKLMNLGLLCKETHELTIRFCPSLKISKEEIDWAIENIKTVFAEDITQ